MHVNTHNMRMHMQSCRKMLTKMRVHMGKTSGRAPPRVGGEKKGGKQDKRKKEEGKRKKERRRSKQF